MSHVTESTLESAALDWFGEMGYGVLHGPNIAPGEPASERKSFADVLLVGRLRDAIQKLNRPATIVLLVAMVVTTPAAAAIRLRQCGE